MKRILFTCAMVIPLGGLLDYMTILAYRGDKPLITKVWMVIALVCVSWICYEVAPIILNKKNRKDKNFK